MSGGLACSCILIFAVSVCIGGLCSAVDAAIFFTEISEERPPDWRGVNGVNGEICPCGQGIV